MTIVLKAEIDITKRRIGKVFINHEGLVFWCDICIYNDEKLWIRMPEFWVDKKNKLRILNWENQEVSDEKQVFILKKVFDMLDLDLEKAICLKKDFFATKKQLTKQENKLTLQT